MPLFIFGGVEYSICAKIKRSFLHGKTVDGEAVRSACCCGMRLPVLGGNLFQLFYTLADTVIVGKTLGADALAAVGSTGIISYFVLCFVQGLTGGFGICLGQCCRRRG